MLPRDGFFGCSLRFVVIIRTSQIIDDINDKK
jgi:hypothetical protein